MFRRSVWSRFTLSSSATDLQAASPKESVPKQVLAADFERQLSDSLNTLFGR